MPSEEYGLFIPTACTLLPDEIRFALRSQGAQPANAMHLAILTKNDDIIRLLYRHGCPSNDWLSHRLASQTGLETHLPTLRMRANLENQLQTAEAKWTQQSAELHALRRENARLRAVVQEVLMHPSHPPLLPLGAPLCPTLPPPPSLFRSQEGAACTVRALCSCFIQIIYVTPLLCFVVAP